MKKRLWWRWGREVRWKEMNELEGVGEEDVAIRELEHNEWVELYQEGSRSLGEDFCSIPDTTMIGRKEQLPVIVDRSSPQRVNGSRTVQEFDGWEMDGEEDVLIGAMEMVEEVLGSHPANALPRSQEGGDGVPKPGPCPPTRLTPNMKIVERVMSEA